jgi:hypothetical protein
MNKEVPEKNKISTLAINASNIMEDIESSIETIEVMEKRKVIEQYLDFLFYVHNGMEVFSFLIKNEFFDKKEEDKHDRRND